MRTLAGCLITAAALIVATTCHASQQSSTPKRVYPLQLQPARMSPAAADLRLLPDPNDLTAGDGAVLYDQAVKALPGNLDHQLIAQWTAAPPSKLPQDEAQAVLDRADAALKLVAQASLCKSCNWPPFVQGTMPANLTEYRELSRLLCLKAKLQIAREQYDEAVETIRTNLTMGKQVGESQTLIQGMVGVAIAGLTLRGVDDLAQSPDSPNLHGALHALPRPLVDLDQTIAAEEKVAKSGRMYNFLTRRAIDKQLEEAYARVRQLMYRLDGQVAGLLCIEALRHHMATHDGQLPETLSEVSDLEVPDDPATGQPFTYRLDGTKAILDVSPPKGAGPDDAVRYELMLAP